MLTPPARSRPSFTSDMLPHFLEPIPNTATKAVSTITATVATSDIIPFCLTFIFVHSFDLPYIFLPFHWQPLHYNILCTAWQPKSKKYNRVTPAPDAGSFRCIFPFRNLVHKKLPHRHKTRTAIFLRNIFYSPTGYSSLNHQTHHTHAPKSASRSQILTDGTLHGTCNTRSP